MSQRPLEQFLRRALADYEQALRQQARPPGEVTHLVACAEEFVAFLLGEPPRG